MESLVNVSQEKSNLIDLRPSELTGIIGRDSINKLSSLFSKNVWEEYRTLYDSVSRLELETIFPIQLDFELNASCNLKCPMCPISIESNTGKGRETWFNFETYAEIIKSGVANGLRAIKLNYVNEPLIRDDLKKFVEFARENGVVDIYLSTNGLLLKEKIIRDLIEAGLTRIQVSIDAYSEEIYEKVRPGGNLKKVRQNVENLIKIKKELRSLTPLVRVNFVRTEINEHELEAFIDLWINKVEMIGVQEMIKPPTDLIQIKSKSTSNKKKNGFRCSFPYKQLVINNEGKILPCCTFYGEKFELGNIKDKSLMEVWTSSDMKELRKIHYQGEYFKNEICRQCVEDGVVEE